MKLVISQMNEGENPFSFASETAGWLKEVLHRVEKQGYVAESELLVRLSLTKLEPDYYLRGQMEFKVRQTCGRCAEAFTLPIRHHFDVALAHVSNGKVRRAELVSEESEELDINFFEGNEIDLSPLIEEQFFLSIPYQSVCRNDCQGICQQCGNNRNREECTCVLTDPLSPFSALSGFHLK